MKIICCNDSRDKDYRTLEKLRPEELVSVELFNPEWGAYWYEHASYEGYGYLLMRKDEKWYLKELCHCSCYGPTNNMEYSSVWKDINTIKR